jgi:uncharacterized protein (TIGR03663 family)
MDNQQRPSPYSLLWIALLFLAATLRLTDLAAAPLNGAEAMQALPAYFVAQGIDVPPPMPPTAVHSPLLYHLNVLLFSLFDAGDGLARLVPALAGTALVLTPLFLRRYLGQWGALGMGLLLALSPTALFASRTVDGTMLAAFGVMLLVACATEFLDTWRPKLVVFCGIGLAIALTAGPGAWAMLVGLLLTVGAAMWAWRDQVEWIWPMAKPALIRGLIVAGVTILILGTGAGFHFAGLSTTGQQFLEWLGRFSREAPATTSPLTLLLVYEPLLLVAGLAGLVIALVKRHAMGMLWGFWALNGGVQLALMPARQPVDLLWVLLPLAGLGGLAVKKLVENLSAYGHWLNEGLHLPISAVLWIHGGLALARYAQTGEMPSLLLAALTLLLQLFLTAAFGFALVTPEPDSSTQQLIRAGTETALRAGGLSLGLVLVLVTFSVGWGLTHVRPSDPREPFVQDAIAAEVRVLVEVVEQTSQLTFRSGGRLPVAFIEQADPALLWALRRFDPQLSTTALVPEELPALVIAPDGEDVPVGYFDETFPTRRSWAPPEWSGYERARWWLYRDTITLPTVSQQVALWVRKDLGTEYSQ